MSDERNILLVFTPKAGYQQDVLEGVRQYTARLPRWSLKGVYQNHPNIIRLIQRRQPHGILGLIEHEDMGEVIANLGIPTVDVASCIRNSPGAQVKIDNTKIGSIAAEFFLAQGFRNFGFLGESTALFSRERHEGFVAALKVAGADCISKFLVDREKKYGGDDEWFGVSSKLGTWLKSLPRPTALLCSHDQYGLIVLNTCRRYDLSVPFDISVLGVDDNALMCHLASPSLSSIRQPGLQIGYQAAKLLDDIIHGEADPHTILTLDTPGIVHRDSTRSQAIADPDVSKALRIIHQNCGGRITVDTLADAVTISRRTLEMKFRRVLGRSIWAEVLMARVNSAEKLIRQTDMKMAAIAHRVGLANVAHLTRIFQQQIGCTPSDYRRRFNDCSNTGNDNAPTAPPRLSHSVPQKSSAPPRRGAQR